MHVLLINEGTYPFHWGGVSTWCHLLIRDLPDVEFTLFSLVADPRYEPQFTLPDNVVDFRAIPLWGICEMLEIREDLTLAALNQRRRQTSGAVVASKFTPIFREFLRELYTSDTNPELLGRLIHQMYRFFQDYDFDTAMRSQETWDCFVAAARELFPETASRHGYPDATFELWDVTQGLQWLYHWLFPLACPLPRTDIVHASTVGICTMIAVVAKLEYGTPYMLSEHGIYLRERYLAETASSNSLFLKLLSLRFARRMSHLSYALADQISPCCDYNQRWEIRNGASFDRLRTIYYGADSGQFEPGGKPVGEPPVVVWVGRINPLKDVITLLKAAALVKETRPDIEFKLFGGAAPEDKAYHMECLALHAELELEDTVTFAGYAPNTAIAYNQGDVVVLCSISEGFPFATLEAMLCGKPVVATAVGGIPEQIEGCGIAVEPRNPRELADAITTLMNDPLRCAELGKAAREIAAQEFTVHQSAEAYRSSYRRLLGYPEPLTEECITSEVMLAAVAEPTELALQEIALGEGQISRQIGGPQLSQPEALGIGLGVPEASASMARSAPDADSGQRPPAGSRSRRIFIAKEPTEWITPDTAAISELAGEVLRRDSHPIDYLEIAAVLESIGVTDQIAAQRYGAPDTFALAENVLEQVRAMHILGQAHAPADQTEPRASIWQTLRDYAGGPIALLPNLVLLIMINVYARLGQWNEGQVLALTLGMTAGMLITNGFVQAIMRRASRALGLGSPRAAGRFLRASLLLAGSVLAGVVVLALLVASGMGWFTFQERLIFGLAFLGLSTIWLMAGVLSLLRAPGWLGLGLLAGLIVGYAIDRLAAPFSSAHLALGTMVGFPVTVGLMFYRMRRPFDVPIKAGKDNRVFLPPTTYLIHEALPYFGYGSLYMILILLPHVLGWAGALGPGQSRSFGISSLEGGLTLSLPPLVLAGGLAERTLRLFWQRALTTQQGTHGQNPERFGQTLMTFYWQQLRRYLLVLALISAGIYALFQLSISTMLLPRFMALPSMAVLVLVFHAGLATYYLIGWGWFNCMFGLTLGRPKLALQALIVAIVITLIVGVPLSLGVHFSYAALAFIAGALAFAATSSWLTYRLLKSADYYYYSAC
jgi:polysaccharide biosynthesis protein PelF